MKIIKEFNQVRCKKCYSLIEFEDKEMKGEVLDKTHALCFINCPACNNRIIVHQLYLINASEDLPIKV